MASNTLEAGRGTVETGGVTTTTDTSTQPEETTLASMLAIDIPTAH